MRLLIADDSAPFRKRLVQMLSQIAGIEIIRAATNGTEALEAARTLHPDVAILDIQMPGASGIEVLREIKRDLNEIVVIMLTGYAEPQYRQKCFELGANYYFSKSANSKELFGLISVLERAGRGKSGEND